MDLQLTGKSAVVTGGSKGIGRALVRLLLAEGMRVVSGSRTITAELKETGAVPVAVDLSTAEGPARLIDSAIAEIGGIDLLVNNVGVGDTDDFAKGVRLNLLELRTTLGTTPSTCTSTARCGPAVRRVRRTADQHERCANRPHGRTGGGGTAHRVPGLPSQHYRQRVLIDGGMIKHV